MSEQTTNTEQTSSVERASHIVAELREAAALIEKRRQDIEVERKRLSYAAVVERDASAVKKMAALVIEANKQASDVETCTAALEEANARLAIAQETQVRQGDVDTAKAIRAGLAEFLESALSLNEAILALSEEGAALFAAVRKLRKLEVNFPTDQQIFVLGFQCLETGLMATEWRKAFPHLAPKDRRSWAALSREWASRIEATYVQPHLGDAEPAKETEEAVA